MPAKRLRLGLSAIPIFLAFAACGPASTSPTSGVLQPSSVLLPSDTPGVPPTQAATPLTPSPPPPTATAPEPYVILTETADLVGTWMSNLPDFTRFDSDGTLRDANTLEDLDVRPYAIGTYEFDDGYLIIREVEVHGVPSCGGKVGKYEVRLLQGGGLQIVLIKDSCGPRAGDMRGIYERVP